MANRFSWLHEETRRLERVVREAMADCRNSRVSSGRTQRELSRQLGISRVSYWRAERNGGLDLTAVELGRIAAANGLRLHIRVYPGPYRLRDTPQIQLIGRFLPGLDGQFTIRTEVGVGPPGDLRAFDLTLTCPEGTAAVDAFARFSDFQAQVRPSMAKHVDGGFDRLIILVAATHANRAALAEARQLIREAFPCDTRTAMRALRAGRLPPADAIVLR